MAGAVTVKGRITRIATLVLQPLSQVQVRLDPDKFAQEKDPGDLVYEVKSQDILFEDDWIILINKPPGIPTEGTVVATRDSLHGAVLRYLTKKNLNPDSPPYLGLHHRLDKETSGVILFTKDKGVNKAIHDMFLHHQAQKTYLALCVKAPGVRSSFTVENHLGRISPKSTAAKWGALAGGDWAKTDFQISETIKNGYLIQAMPLTGRTHQIRVHLSGVGLPLWGDELYGGPMVVGETKIPRVMLHALKLTFPHPHTHEIMTIQAPLPPDFLALLKKKQ